MSLSRTHYKKAVAARAAGPAPRLARPRFAWMSVLITAFIVGSGALLSGCGPKTGAEVTTPSGLKYIDEVIGKGEKARLGKTVAVQYTGTLTDGTKFDSSLDSGKPYEFRLGAGSVIRGWEEGILSMHVGGKRRLIVPPDLGYGAQGKGQVPPNATLIFELELLDIK